MSAEQTKWRNLLLNILKNSCVGILCLISQGLLHTHSATCCPGIPQSFRNRDHVSRLSQKWTLRDLAAQWPVLTRTQFGFGTLLAWILLSSCIITSRSEEYHPWAAQEVLSLLLGKNPQRGLARWLYSEGREGPSDCHHCPGSSRERRRENRVRKIILRRSSYWRKNEF